MIQISKNDLFSQKTQSDRIHFSKNNHKISGGCAAWKRFVGVMATAAVLFCAGCAKNTAGDMEWAKRTSNMEALQEEDAPDADLTMENPGVSDSRESGQTYVIGVSLPTTRLAFRASMYELLLEYSKQESERRVQLKIRDADGSQKQQNQDILELVDSGVDGILLVPNTMEGCLSAVAYANQKKIPVLTVDNQIEASAGAKAISFIGADHEKMGEDAARLFISILQEKFPEKEQWKVIELTGIPDSSGAVDRGRGIREILSHEDRIELLGSYNGEFTVENAKSVIEDCLGIYDEIDGVICQNDNMAEGCYRALAEAGKAGRVAVVGIDGNESTLRIMTRGGIDGTVLQRPDMILEGISLLCDALNGETLNDVYFEPTEVVTSENADKYLQELQTMENPVAESQDPDLSR